MPDASRSPSEPRARLGALRLLMITAGRGDADGTFQQVCAAVAGGVRAVQVREHALNARELAALCARLRPVLEDVGGLLLVNDRVDVAAAGHAHGVQLGFRSLSVADARAVLRPGQVIGVSVHEDRELQAAAAAGADFALLAPVLPTSSKPGAPCLGLLRAAAWTARAGIPVVWLGGLDASSAAMLADLPPGDRPAGIAVKRALSDSPHPTAAARAILAALPAMAAPGPD